MVGDQYMRFGATRTDGERFFKVTELNKMIDTEPAAKE